MLLVALALAAVLSHFVLLLLDGSRLVPLCSNNLGVSFGLFAESNQWVIISVSAIFLVLMALMALKEGKKSLRTAIVGICIASLGNLIDRVVGNGVCDYVRIPLLPVSNFNDWVISIYLVYYMYLSFRLIRNEKNVKNTD